MSAHPNDPKSTTAERPDADTRASQQGLSSDELQAEQADDLPDREAMTVLSVGGLGIDVPPADRLDDFLNTDVSTDIHPVDTLPVTGDVMHEDGFLIEDPGIPVTVTDPQPSPVDGTGPIVSPVEVTGPLPSPVDPVIDPPIGIPGPISDDTTLEV